jgi:hypothetical protein
MVKPTELLKDFGMLGIRLNNAFISVSCAAVLTKYKGQVNEIKEK